MRSVQERPFWCTKGDFGGPVSTPGGYFADGRWGRCDFFLSSRDFFHTFPTRREFAAPSPGRVGFLRSGITNPTVRVSSGPAAHPPGYGEGPAALPSQENPPHHRFTACGFGVWRVTYLLIAYYRKYDYLFSITHILINLLSYRELRATAKTGRSQENPSRVRGCMGCLRICTQLLPMPESMRRLEGGRSGRRPESER